MKIIVVIVRITLGLPFVVFGANGLFEFMDPAGEMSAEGQAFVDALWATGYSIPLMAATQLLSGLMLWSGRFVPLALALLAPVIVQILAFHLFLEPQGTAVAIALAGFEATLVWAYWEHFRSVVRIDAKPRTA